MRKVLVVVDMQNDFITGSLGTKEAQAIVPNVIDKIKEHMNTESYIFLTRDTHNTNYLETQEGKNLPVEHCIYWTKGHEIRKDILNALTIDNNNTSESTYFLHSIKDKFTFGSLDLANALKHYHSEFCEISEIELVGVCTDICIVSNAILIKTVLPEIKVTVDASCCAGVTPEKHKMALEVMKSCQVNVINY